MSASEGVTTEAATTEPTTGRGKPDGHRLDQIPTVDLLGEIRRRQAILSRPERRVLLTGPQGAGVGIATQAARLARAWGICDINHQQLIEEGGEEVEEGGVPVVVDAMKAPQCRRGFVLHHIHPDNSALSIMKIDKELEHFGMSPIDTAVIIEPKKIVSEEDDTASVELKKTLLQR